MTKRLPSSPFATAKRLLRSTLRRAGIEVRRVGSEPAVYEPPPIYEDPFEALHIHRGGKLAAFHCPLEHCITFSGFTHSENGWHPFSAALEEFGKGNSRSYEGSLLEKYYAVWQPEDALDALICLNRKPSALCGLPNYAYVLPWKSQTLDDRLRYLKRWYRSDNKEHGYPELSVDVHGFKNHGPVDPLLGKLEYGRLTSIFRSISETGYRREYGDTYVRMLKRGSEVRYFNRGGFHRTAAMKALGYETVPAVFKDLWIIDVKDVDYWPQVQWGVWDRESAIRYFHHLFDFDAREWARRRGLLPENQTERQATES